MASLNHSSFLLPSRLRQRRFNEMQAATAASLKRKRLRSASQIYDAVLISALAKMESTIAGILLPTSCKKHLPALVASMVPAFHFETA